MDEYTVLIKCRAIAVERETKGAFQKSELAGWTLAGPDILAMK